MTVRLIPPAYVKPFVKRQKNDAADAEAICEAAQRPTMRFVAVKSEEQQASGVVFRTRDLLVRQRTQLINALRGHLDGVWLGCRRRGLRTCAKLIAADRRPECQLPQSARASFRSWSTAAGAGREHRRARSRDRPRVQGGRGRASADDDPGHRPDHRHGAHRAGAAGSRPSARGATSPPGSGSRRCRTRPAASSGSARPRRWASERCAVC